MRVQPFVLAAGLILTSATLAAQSPPRDYEQWRGQHRDGAASAFVPPASWPGSLTRQWRVPVGEGYGTPLVSGDIVYVFTRHDEHETMAALDARTGIERWHSSYAALYTPSQSTAAHGSGPKATPLLHGGRLFTLGISGMVTAFDAATGKPLWQTPAPAEPPFFSAASSPLGENGIVIVHPGNYGPLTAFDGVTGAVRWTAGSGGTWASPIAVDLHGTRQVVSATQDSVIGVSLDGDVLWRYPWLGANGSTTPVVSDDTIIVGSPEGVTAIRPSLRDGTWAAETVWDTKEVTIYLSNPVVVAGTLFGLSTKSRGQFFAIDVKTGAVLWLGKPREADNTAVVKAGDLLLLLNNDAEMIVARADRNRFEPIARYTVGASATWAQPAISGNRIFVKDVDSLSLWTIE